MSNPLASIMIMLNICLRFVIDEKESWPRSVKAENNFVKLFFELGGTSNPLDTIIIRLNIYLLFVIDEKESWPRSVKAENNFVKLFFELGERVTHSRQ